MMEPVYQTDTTFESGNCCQACIASILEIPLESIPQFHNPDDPADGEYYCQKMNEFLDQFGLAIIDIELKDGYDPEDWFKDCWVIATGLSDFATEDWHNHAVVWKNGKTVHNPRKGCGELKNIKMYGVFVIKDPLKLTDTPETK